MVLVDSRRVSPAPRYSGFRLAGLSYIYRTITFFGAAFQRSSVSILQCRLSVLQPPGCRNNQGLGSSQFARRYFGNSYWSLFLQVLRCFSSLRSPPFRDTRLRGWVAPFGHLRIIECLPLPAAFRSLPRPSSPLCA